MNKKQQRRFDRIAEHYNLELGYPAFDAREAAEKVLDAECRVKPSNNTISLWECPCGECEDIRARFYREEGYGAIKARRLAIADAL